MNKAKRLLISMLTLLCCTGVWAEGELNGKFTINASGGKVQFSQGNLQYFCSTTAPEWHFAEHQYDYVAFDISAYAANSEKWIDLFAHGTSGYDNGQTNYQPYVVGAAANTYYQGNLTGNADWGYNAISNGGNTENSGWRTLTKDEWLYLFLGRSNAASKYGHGSINGVNGMILLPDSWTLPDGLSFTPGNSVWTNSYTLEQWALMENAGAVFLPASGSANSTGIPPESTQNQNGFYRASTAAYYMHFGQSTLENCTMSFYQYGDAVRLVKDYQLQQDASGNYLIGSADDWKLFAAIVNNGTNLAVNAKMTADINLGDDQTKIGIVDSKYFSGTFDGQGHTLTIRYVHDPSKYVDAPFLHINNATIKNIHVAGTINSEDSQPAPIGLCKGTNTIENLWSSLVINCTPSGSKWQETSAIVGLVQNGSLTIRDCIYTGSNTSTGSYNGCFVGYINGDGSATITNCLSVGEFNYSGSGSGFRGTHTNCYVKQFPASYPAGVTQTTDETLADGTIAYKLQADRVDLIWGQRIGTDSKPVLTNDESYRVYKSKNGGYTNDPTQAYEGLEQDAEGNYLIGSVYGWRDFATLVQTTPTANAKMTADIDLSTQITMIAEDFDHPYQGTFDGQGYTLTVNWTADGEDRVAPFRYADGATIKRLHVDGSIRKTGTEGRCPAGILACSIGNATTNITECWSSVSLYAFDTIGGLFSVACGNSTTNIIDCVFSGMISASNSSGYSGGFASHADKTYLYNTQGAPTVNITRGLNLGTFTGNNTSAYTFIRGDANSVYGTHTVNSCYYKNVYGNAQGILATTDQLADGTTTTALNAGRTGNEAVWVQDPVTNQPMLAIFANTVTLTDGNDLSALSTHAGKTCTVAYSRSFTEGKPSTVCLPFAYAKGTVGTFYTFTGISMSGDEYIADMTEYTGDNLVANTPYLFRPSATASVDFSGTYTLPASITAGSTTSGDWTYLGTYETIEWTEAPTGIYGFSAQAVADQGISQGEFVKVGEYVRIKPMRCYLKYKNGSADYAGSRGLTRAATAGEQLPDVIKVRLISANGEVTAIGNLQTKTGEVTIDSEAWYSIDGRRIVGKPSAKGIYIRSTSGRFQGKNNGKKVVIK